MDTSSADAARLLGHRLRVLGSRCGGAAPDEVLEIEAALARIAEGTYGACEVCGGAIGRDRLRALPEVRRCLACSG
jgi:RNA polymerase-binding transcription factor DksA